ncbi:hypothetical protein EQZ01_01070 [Bacillus subtilis]|uniref:hypothetical protein n=1 Tax=Bacillus subtilis TaxID=1423 RepID=UPI000FFE1CF2|nr:hypothetical protein [Bacillus subtilis]QAT44348.1 hypothetical protein EQZ01_01070 [Bacillus subtilis]
MDIVKTILTSWPLAIVIIVFAIRGSLKKIIENRLFSFKVGNVEVTFDRLLQEVDESLQDESPEINEGCTTNKESKDAKETVETKSPQESLAEQKKARELEAQEKKRIYNLISEDPEKAITRSWSLVFQELKRLGEKNGLDRRISMFDNILYNLIRNDEISKNTFSALIRLYQIIVLVKTSKNGYKWTEEDASSFYKSCRLVLRQLRNI